MSLVIALITGILSLALRGTLTRPTGATLLVLLAMLPFVLDALDVISPVRLRLPLFAFPVPTLVAASLLVWHPPHNDFAPFFFVVVVSAVSARADENFPFAVIVGAASVALIASAEIFGPYRVATPWVIGICFGWFGGFTVGKLIRTLHALREAQADLADRAAADERRRIAREMHDVIAHSLSVTLLHLSGARMGLQQLAREQPSERLDDAIEALRQSEEHGRSSLGDIKRTIGLLGPAALDATHADDSHDLRRLVADFAAAGVKVELNVDGDIGGLPPASALNLYRIVQESLTNVVKHAPGASADVDLVVGDDNLRLVVHNGPCTNGAHHIRAPSSGLGVTGMNERASALGGALHTGPEGGGWTVELTVPASVYDT